MNETSQRIKPSARLYPGAAQASEFNSSAILGKMGGSYAGHWTKPSRPHCGMCYSFQVAMLSIS